MADNNREFVASFDNATNKIIRDVLDNVEACCLLVVAEAKKECPVDEGVLRASITHEVKEEPDKITGFVGSNLTYAPYVHEGTGIYAKNGQGRKTPWKWKGESKKYKGWHMTKGQKPKPFLDTAILKNKDNINKILGKGGGT